MSTKKIDVKMPSYSGLKRAQKMLKDMYKRKPSDELIKIINDLEAEKEELNKADEKISAEPPEVEI
jgi:hypothetical protein